MGSTAEQTLIGFISVDNNAHRLCNLCADLPEERLNGKIPALKPAGLLCSTPSVWTPNFLVECHCVHSIMLCVFSSFFPHWNKVCLIHSYELMVFLPLKALAATLWFIWLGKIFEFSLKWNWVAFIKQEDTLFCDFRTCFHISWFKPWKCVEAINLTQLLGNFFFAPLFFTPESYNMSKSCAVLIYGQDKPIQLRTCYWKLEERRSATTVPWRAKKSTNYRAHLIHPFIIF